MINKVLNFVNEHRMFEENDYVVAGVSGGADSVCLLFVLLEIRKRIPVTIHVVHINHGIREEAGVDAEYVEKLCRENNVTFTLVEEDVEALARKMHLSSEEAGRIVRYKAFNDALKGHENGKIAIAHNMNDSCETFLFNLFRGSGLKGLSGIRPVRDRIVRPLLCVERAQIEEYLNQNSIHFCIDRTNNEDNYTRNRIRHHILPAAKEMVSPRAVSHIKEAAEKISDACDLIDELTIEGYSLCVRTEDKKYFIDSDKLHSLHKTVQSYVLRKVISEACGVDKDIEAVHIEQLGKLFDRQCGRAINLPYGIIAVRNYEGVWLGKKEDNKSSEENIIYFEIGEEEKKKLLNKETIVCELPDGARLQFKVYESSGIENISTKTYTKCLDYDKIKDNIVVRHRNTRDYLTINSLNQRKSLKAFFVNEKIPKDDRDRILLVTEKEHCMWIIGNRISNYYKVSESTHFILEITYEED